MYGKRGSQNMANEFVFLKIQTLSNKLKLLQINFMKIIWNCSIIKLKHHYTPNIAYLTNLQKFDNAKQLF